jgi:hypothetical protein
MDPPEEITVPFPFDCHRPENGRTTPSAANNDHQEPSFGHDLRFPCMWLQECKVLQNCFRGILLVASVPVSGFAPVSWMHRFRILL